MQSVVTLSSQHSRASNKKRSAAQYKKHDAHCAERNARGDGRRLVDLLLETAYARDDSMMNLAAILGIHHTRISHFASGMRHIADSERRLLVAIASYLNLPVAQVYLLADALEPSDFYATYSLPVGLASGWVAMSLDPEWCGFVPGREEWLNLPERTRTALVLLYSQVSGKTYLPPMAVPAVAGV